MGEPIGSEHLFLQYHFKTSAYPDAKTKWLELFNLNEQHVNVSLINDGLVQEITIGGEGFDEYELKGTNGNAPFYYRFSIAGSQWLNNHQYYLGIRTIPGAIDACSLDPIYTNLHYEDVADPILETFRIDTFMTISNSSDHFVEHYGQVGFRSFLPEMVFNETYELIHNVDQYLRNFVYPPEFNNQCGIPQTATLSNLVNCFSDFGCVKLDVFLSDLVWDALPYKVPISGDTKLSIDYNSKPLTNKGMGVITLNVPETKSE